MDITYRIPSKKVPYGYIEFTWERDGSYGLPSPDELASEYADYIREYQSAEVAAFETAPIKPKPQAKPNTSVEEAAKMLSDGLGGAEEIDEDAPVKPWDKTSDETESTTEKPWDLDDSDWDM